ncbi:MAG: decarboxylase [Burkholderiales bacterium]|nr:decarboxylase [Burkholderiales bacterium]
MSEASASNTLVLSDFFAASERRTDTWAKLDVAARAWAAAAQRGQPTEALAAEAVALVAELGPLEAFFAYPGLRLMELLRERMAAADAALVARLAREIAAALVSGAYRHDAAAWDPEVEAEISTMDFIPAPLAAGPKHRPYFEVLSVTPTDPVRWERARADMRKLRRAEDPFVYELVQAGSFEDALLAVLFNGNLQAVVLLDGFGFRSVHDLSHVRDYLKEALGFDPDGISLRDYGPALARLIHRLRPELDVYLLSEREIESMAGRADGGDIRRFFHGAEELMELHLAVLEGVTERYRTPYFDNLKHYAQRPIGTFHALPIARGKSVFKSNWIRDLGEFYGANLFLAESSATTGGLDSLLEPTGNIKWAQEAAARAFGGDHAFFVTNGTSTSNKIVHSALVRPGDIVLIDRDCHKSHHYGLVIAGGQPYYIDAYPLAQYSMYGSVPIRPIKAALLKLKAEGKLAKVRMLVLTNCTFDGHVANVKRTMEECLAIKPDLIFLWDEAWYGYARFTPFLRRRTGLGGAALLREQLQDPGYRKRYEQFKAQAGDLDPANAKLLDMHLLPDPDRARVRVYETDSVHKSMSSLRQGSIVVVKDQDFADVEEAFHEAYFTHTSTSPNLQIIATLDVARRQMELEGYELVGRMMQLALTLRREINGHPLISKYFRAATPAEMIPEQYRASGFDDFGSPKGTWAHWLRALDQDEFFLDPTRITLLCGNAGYDGSEFKALLAEEHDIQINKTSRNSVLVQININNTRSDLAHIIKALADMARAIEKRLADGGAGARAAFAERVKSLVQDVPDLPDFSRFHDAFRDDPKGTTAEGHMRRAYYMAYDAANCEHVKLYGSQIDDRLKNGPELVSANFVIPYPPGFPIMVPGQVIGPEIIEFMRKLDVKEIHGYQAALGLKLLKPSALSAVRAGNVDR